MSRFLMSIGLGACLPAAADPALGGLRIMLSCLKEELPEGIGAMGRVHTTLNRPTVETA